MVNRSFVQSRAGISRHLVQSAAVALVLLMPSSSFALDGELSNQQTGADSVNTNTVTTTNDLTATLTNNATVTNDFTFHLNTGNNSITNNTTVGDITTGDIDVQLKAETKVNEVDQQQVDALLNSLNTNDGTSIQSTNSNTGSNSQNNNQTTVTHTSTVQIQNNMNVNNTLSLDLNTGNNTIEDNTTVGNISTGDISVIATILTEGNGKGGGFFPGDDGNNGGDQGTGNGSGSGPVTIAQLPPSVITAATPTTSSISGGKGGGQFFPAGGNPNIALELLTFVLAAILLVRFQELSPIILSRLQHKTAKQRVQ